MCALKGAWKSTPYNKKNGVWKRVQEGVAMFVCACVCAHVPAMNPVVNCVTSALVPDLVPILCLLSSPDLALMPCYGHGSCSGVPSVRRGGGVGS